MNREKNQNNNVFIPLKYKNSPYFKLIVSNLNISILLY